jgi:hypothetical protein
MPYVFKCMGCGRLANSERSITVTCSPACRKDAHRAGKIKQMRAFAAQCNTTLADILHSEAVLELRPDLEDAILAGKLTIKQAQQEIWPLYTRQVLDATQATLDTTTP